MHTPTVANPHPPQLIEAAEAKAFYCLSVNYATLESLYKALLDKEVLTGAEVRSAVQWQCGWQCGWQWRSCKHAHTM